MTISEIGKVALIERLLSSVQGSFDETLLCADTINSHKIFMEGINFDLVYMPLKHLGYKSVVQTIGHIYAKNYTPQNLSVNIALSSRFTVEDMEELWKGVSAATAEHKINAVTLDLLPSLTGLTISLSSTGKQNKETIVHTSPPKSGDLLCITGSLGAAWLGLQVLEREKIAFKNNPVQPKLEKYKFILKSYLNPELDRSIIETLNRVTIIPSYGEFVTKGLADAVKMTCNAVGLGAKIFLNRLPIASQTFDAAEEFGIEATTAALNGGDDTQMLFVIPLERYDELLKEVPQLDVIGHLCSIDAGTKLITPDGIELELKAQAWNK